MLGIPRDELTAFAFAFGRFTICLGCRGLALVTKATVCADATCPMYAMSCQSCLLVGVVLMYACSCVRALTKITITKRPAAALPDSDARHMEQSLFFSRSNLSNVLYVCVQVVLVCRFVELVEPWRTSCCARILIASTWQNGGISPVLWGGAAGRARPHIIVAAVQLTASIAGTGSTVPHST